MKGNFKLDKRIIKNIAVGLIVITGILATAKIADEIVFCRSNNLNNEKIAIGSAGNVGNTNKAGDFALPASGVVPHHLMAEEIIDDFFRRLSLKGDIKTIILLSPDHFNKGILAEKELFITLKPNTEKFNRLEVDNFLLRDLAVENKFIFNNSFVAFDHGITNLLPFIKKYFPETKILPILVPSGINKEETKYLMENVNSRASSGAIVVASVDFSHYLPESAAEFHDVKSARVLINFEERNFENLEADCWQCLYGARLFAELKNKEFPQVIARKNSAEFSKIKNQEETTSYFSVIFGEGAFQEGEKIEGRTILFVGDIMLDREAERLMKKNSIFYPFQKISQFTRGVDLVFGNLEGPIVKNPPNFSYDSLKFAFRQEVAEGLKFANFNLLSLANNHTLNMGKNGLRETREFLKKEGINFVGDPLKCVGDFLYQKDNITFLAFNKTYSSGCSDEEIIETVKSVRASNPENFLIASLHWGKEYQLKSSASQQNLGRKIIGAGADIIIGHHPHVVQEVEVYKGKLIFYSLGNFIFDQYFSKDVQQGLAVGLEIYPEKLVYRIFPVQSKLSQPFLMEQKDAEKFLEKLAERSDQSLVNGIKRGIIEKIK